MHNSKYSEGAGLLRTVGVSYRNSNLSYTPRKSGFITEIHYHGYKSISPKFSFVHFRDLIHIYRALTDI